MQEMNWGIVWMFVVLIVVASMCYAIIMAIRDQMKDNSLNRKIKEHEAFGDGANERPRVD